MEEVIVTAIVFGSVLGMLKLWLDYRRDKNQMKASSTPSADASLTTSELRELLTDAVDEAVDRRFDRLEARLEERDRARLMPASTTPAPDEPEMEHPAPPLVRGDRESME